MKTASQQGVTHEDLDRAADEATTEEVVEVEEVAEEEEVVEEETTEEDFEEEEEETEEEPAVVAEPTDNAERTKLGRKVARQEAQLSEIQSVLDRLANFMEDKGEVRGSIIVDDDDEDAFLTPENLPKYLERENKKRETEQSKYQKRYTSEFASIGRSDENFEDIWEIMLDKHNTIETGDPSADAKINFYKARATFLENNRVTNPVKGKGSKTNTSVNLPNKMKGKTPVKVKLDAHAAEFVKKRGLSDEFVQKTLSKR